MHIAIFGSGGVGGYFGGRLAAAGTDVTFIARGAHLDALRTRGLRIESPLGNVHLPRVRATDDPSTIGPVDVVFFTVKLYDTESAMARLPPLIGPQTVVVPFQNGVQSIAALTRAVGAPHTAGGTAFVYAVVTEPGVIRHTANDRLTFGELDGSRSARLEQLQAACLAAGFKATLSEQIEIDIWIKFVWLTVFSGVTIGDAAADRCAARRSRSARVMSRSGDGDDGGRARQGIALPAKVIDDMIAGFQALPPQARSSMLDDLERGRRLELPWLSGGVVRLGEEAGVMTPTHRFITTVLMLYAAGRPSMAPAA